VEDRSPSNDAKGRSLVPRVADRKEGQIAPKGRIGTTGNVVRLVFLSDRFVIQENVEISAVVRAGIRCLSGSVFSMAK
jgi:hypothetical protein